MLWRLLIAVLSVAAAPATAESRRDYDLSGAATVVNGDTINIETASGTGRDRRVIRTRLLGVDAPQFPTADGIRARDALRALVPDGETVQCRCEMPVTDADRCRRDHYGATLAVCTTTKAADLGKHMVQQGWARARSDCRYVAEEREARAASRGLWPALGAIPAKCN